MTISAPIGLQRPCVRNVDMGSLRKHIQARVRISSKLFENVAHHVSGMWDKSTTQQHTE